MTETKQAQVGSQEQRTGQRTPVEAPKPWRVSERIANMRGPIRTKVIIVDADDCDVCLVYGETTDEARRIAQYIIEATNEQVSID
jgi:hypothetical protein